MVVCSRAVALPLWVATLKVKDSHYRHPRHHSLCADYSAADDCANATTCGYEQYVRECSRTAERGDVRDSIANADDNLQHLEPNLPHLLLYLELQRLCCKLQCERLEGHSGIYRRAGSSDDSRHSNISNKSLACTNLPLE